MNAKKEDPVEDVVPSCSQPLGGPIPNDEHACSVSLPSWSSVVGYEEGEPSITSAMKCGYPRFVYHPTILQLMNIVVDRFSKNNSNNNKHYEDCLVVPGYAAALRCQAFLQQALEGSTETLDNALICTTQESSPAELQVTKNSNIRVVNLEASDVYAVMFPAKTVAGMQAKAYWQHTGEIVSSRRAEEALFAMGIPLETQVTTGPDAPYIYHPSKCLESDGQKSSSLLRKRIANWTKVESEENVFLAPSGMASIYTALRSARRFQLQQCVPKGGRAVVFGFPYLDTLKMCSRSEIVPGGVEFFGMGDEQDLKLLEQLLNQKNAPQICAVFTEVPSNPLLQCPDLHALRKLADQHNFALVVDETIGNFLNIDMIQSGIADAVCTSLTKLFSGRGDVIAGSIVCNPYTEKGRWMQKDLQKEYSGATGVNDTGRGLFSADARAILHNSSDFEERNEQINETSEILADWLVEHEDVQKVYYPKYSQLYPSLLTGPNSGYGGLMSILLQSHMCQRTFYDSLNVAKGPSLGTNFTLVCPYTLLAHYHELDFAMSYNVPPNLLRIAVGLEPVDVLKNKFEEAFSKSRLYPKLKRGDDAVPKAQHRMYSTVTRASRYYEAETTTSSWNTNVAMARRFLRRLPLR